MEQKMKRIPFDLQLAKQGVAFKIFDNDVDSYLIGEYNNQVWYKSKNKDGNWMDGILRICPSWYHLVPDEPKAERWAVVKDNLIYNSQEEAMVQKDLFASRYNYYTVVKLAD